MPHLCLIYRVTNRQINKMRSNLVRQLKTKRIFQQQKNLSLKLSLFQFSNIIRSLDIPLGEQVFVVVVVKFMLVKVIIIHHDHLLCFKFILFIYFYSFFYY